MFKKTVNNVEYQILSMDGDLTLIHKMNSNYQPYVVVEGLNLERMDWHAGHYFSNYEQAHDYFLNEVNEYDINYHRKMFKTMLAEELDTNGVCFEQDDLDELYEWYMDNCAYSTFFDKELLNDLITQNQYNHCPKIETMGKIMNDMFEIAKSSDNHTWFLNADEFIDRTYTQEDLDELYRDKVKISESGVDNIDSIIELYDSWEEAKECGDPVATFYGDFLRMFDKNEYLSRMEEEHNSYDEFDEYWSL